MSVSVAQPSAVAHVLPTSLCRKERAGGCRAAGQARGADGPQVPGLGWWVWGV